MSPRPKTKSDEDILAAAWRAVQHVGPARLTLARVAKEARLSPATLVQRFGSKRKLLLLMVGSHGEGDHWLAQARVRLSSPLELIRDFFDCFAGMATSPKEMANHLAFLQMDITDPAFHRLALAQGADNERIVRGLLEEAVEAKELRSHDATRLARFLMNLCAGSLLGWAIGRGGTAKSWLRSDIELALEPYLTARAS